jgi:hypothetical protein
MRDLVAKITPGLIAIFATMAFFFNSIECAKHFLSQFSYWQWLLLPIAWITGFVLQHAGIMSWWWLTDLTYKNWKKKNDGAQKERFRIKVEILVRTDQEFLKALERTVVIKEACGNFSVALLYALIPASVKIIGCHGVMAGLILIGATAVPILVLWRSHRFQVEREERLREGYDRYQGGRENKDIKVQ